MSKNKNPIGLYYPWLLSKEDIKEGLHDLYIAKVNKSEQNKSKRDVHENSRDNC